VLPRKETVYPSAVKQAAGGGGKKKKLAKDGRVAVERLKLLLPHASLTQLKKMCGEAKIPVGAGANKESIIPLLVDWVCPGYPFEDPYGKAGAAAAEEGEGGGEDEVI